MTGAVKQKKKTHTVKRRRDATRSVPQRVLLIHGGDELGVSEPVTISDVEVSINDAEPFRHCDDYSNDPLVPEPLRKYLAFARAPAHGAFVPKPHPQLYADYEGKRVRVTMASRLGDVGITKDFTRDMGYDRRVPVSQLSNFSEQS